MFAVCQTGGRSEASLVLKITLVRDLFASDLLPQNFSGLTIESHDYKLLRLGWLLATHSASASAGASTRPTWASFGWCAGRLASLIRLGFSGVGGLGLNLFACGNRSLNEDLVFPDDRRGGAGA